MPCVEDNHSHPKSLWKAWIRTIFRSFQIDLVTCLETLGAYWKDFLTSIIVLIIFGLDSSPCLESCGSWLCWRFSNISIIVCYHLLDFVVLILCCHVMVIDSWLYISGIGLPSLNLRCQWYCISSFDASSSVVSWSSDKGISCMYVVHLSANNIRVFSCNDWRRGRIKDHLLSTTPPEDCLHCMYLDSLEIEEEEEDSDQSVLLLKKYWETVVSITKKVSFASHELAKNAITILINFLQVLVG